MRAKRRLLASVTVLAMVISACGAVGSDPTSTTAEDGGLGAESLTVVATTSILGDVVSNVIGDDATLEVIIPVGADAHDFQASPQQVSTLSTADLVVAVGLGLEEGLHDALEGAETDGAHVLEVASLVDPLPFGESEDCESDEAENHDHEDHDDEEGTEDHDQEDLDDEEGHDHDEHDHGSCDPHIWMDPLRMAEAAHLIAEELEEIAPGGGWEERAEAYANDLSQANDEIVAILSGIPEASRKLVTNHEALGYFASAYDFEIVGVVIPGGSTLGDPSSAELAALVDVIREQQVSAIFTDLSSPSGLAETVAEEAGSEISVVGLYTESLGEPGSGADTLIGMLTTNAQNVADALS